MKRILSILLSALLAVSAFGISASARTLGDVDGDKAARSSDALKILMYSVGTLDSIDEKLADVNCDGIINSSDALTVLRISVGLYEGPTDVDLKPEIIDPITATGKFTISTVIDDVDENGDPISMPTTIMVNGNDICIQTKVEGFNARILVLNNKAYLVFPDFRMYAELDDTDIGNLDFSNISVGSGVTYCGSEFVTEGKNTYTVDSYKSEDGTISNYYFLDGKWAKAETVNGSQKKVQTITDFKSGVNKSYFSLAGMIKIDPSQL